MKMKKKWTVLSVLLSGILLMEANAYDLKNPALNPVRIQKSETHEDLVLVKDGKLNFAILTNKNAESHVRNTDRQSIPAAIDTLVTEIEKCTGSKPEVFDVNEAEKAKKYAVSILVGNSVLTQKLGIDVAKLPREGFLVKTFPGTIVIAGNDTSQIKDFTNHMNARRATLWGAYDFLERFFGCRYYFPGEYGSLNPKVTNLTLNPLAYIDAPRFKNRSEEWVLWEFYGYGNKEIFPKLIEKFGSLDRNSINKSIESWRLARTDSFWAGHNPRPEGILSAYPDKKDLIFYRSPTGNLYYNPKGHTGNYFDVTNLKFADLLIDSLKRCYASNGKDRCGWAFVKDAKNDRYIPFGQCDSDVPLPDMIQNPTVVKEKLLTRKHIDGGYQYADIYARFFQYLANRVKQEFPGKKLVLIPYAAYAKPPLDPRWKLPDNVELRVCIGRFPAWSRNPKVVAEEKAKLRGWYENLGKRPIASLWLYNPPNSPFADAIAPQLIGDIPKIYGKTLGDVELFFDQYGASYFTYYYANYAGVRAMWNPDFNSEAAIAEHWIPFYGSKAGAYLKEFHKILFDTYMSTFVPRMDREWNPLYPLQSINKMEELLNKAKAALDPNSVEMKRFQIFAEPFYDAIVSHRNRHSYSRPSYGMHQMLSSEKITVDGEKEAFWDRLEAMPLQDPNGNGRKIAYPAGIKLAWDKQGIYGLVDFPYPPVADPQKSVWDNCSVEIFLSPGTGKEDYYQFAVDAMNQKALGARHLVPVAQPYNGHWVCPDFKSAVTRSGKGWILEFFVPYKDLKIAAPKAYDAWFGNIVINKKSEPSEYSSTAMTLGNNHNIDMFGYLRFLGKGE